MALHNAQQLEKEQVLPSNYHRKGSTAQERKTGDLLPTHTMSNQARVSRKESAFLENLQQHRIYVYSLNN
eukprot:8251497-Ditylum_brightwellii.AAC.1